MAFGFEITNSNGKVYATPDTPFMHMTSKLVHTFTGTKIAGQAESIDTGISASLRLIPYAKNSAQVYFTAEQYKDTKTNRWFLRCEHSGDTTTTFYFFTNSIPPAARGWGLEIYDAKGTRIYSSSTLPLQNHQISMTRNNPASHLIDMKQPVATIPQNNSFWVQPFQGGMQVQLFFAAATGVGNNLYMGAFGGPLMPSESGFSFDPFGGQTNYIFTSLYD